jgi:hypothetical protein
MLGDPAVAYPLATRLVSPARFMEPTLKKIVLAGILLVAGSASSYTADLPERTYTKASVAEAAYNWSGFYVGANAATFSNSDR